MDLLSQYNTSEDETAREPDFHSFSQLLALTEKKITGRTKNPRDQYQTALQHCLCSCSLGGKIFKDFSEVVGREVKGFRFSCARSYEKKCKVVFVLYLIVKWKE